MHAFFFQKVEYIINADLFIINIKIENNNSKNINFIK